MPTRASRRSRVVAPLAALFTLGVTTVAVAAPAVADPLDACTPTSGAVVAVDFRPFGGQILRGCDISPTTSFDLLHEAGFSTVGTAHDEPGFICRIGNADFDGGTQYPKPEQDACELMPPETARWSYWYAEPGQDDWTYSPIGATAKVPVAGEVEAWVHGGRPTFTPDDARAGGAASTPTPTPTAGTGRTATDGDRTPGPTGGASASVATSGALPTLAGRNLTTPQGTEPDLVKGVAWLVAPQQLIDGRYYESFPGFPDFGLSIDGAFALAATGGDDAKLRAITEFIRGGGRIDGHVGDSEFTVDAWLGVGTQFPSGGAIGKVALLAQVTGYDPRAFGGHDLIAALHDVTCTGADDTTGCAGAGNYRNAASVFSQVLGIMAQLRAGQAQDAAAPIAYLKSLQRDNGAFPSLIPAEGSGDEVDSTAMAAMALAMLADDPAAATAVDRALTWLAGQQEAGGGFPGAAGTSANSTALAVQGLTLRRDTYTAQLGKALAFLAGQQNPDGGFNVAADGQPGSDLRASAQVVGGATGISFATLLRDVNDDPDPTPSASASASSSSAAPPPAAPTGRMPVTGEPIATLAVAALALIGAGVVLVLLARRRGRPVTDPADPS